MIRSLLKLCSKSCKRYARDWDGVRVQIAKLGLATRIAEGEGGIHLYWCERM